MYRLGSVRNAHQLGRQGPLRQYQVRNAIVQRRRRNKPAPGTPLRKSFPLYQVPSVVLDLDAEDNPHVRQYDELDKADEVAKWAVTPDLDAIVGRISEFTHEAAQADTRMRSIASSISPWRVSNQDVLSVALLGASQLSYPPPAGSVPGWSPRLIGRVLHQNGIPPGVLRNDNDTIQFMLHRQHLARGKRLDDAREFRAVFLQCQSLSEKRRLIATASETEPGCQTVSHCSAEICQSLVGILKGPADADTTSTLELVNNLTTNLNSRKIGVEWPLCHLGLQAASATFRLSAVERYLRIGLDAGYFQPEQETMTAASSSLLASLSAILKNLRDATSDGILSTHAAQPGGIRSELFTLLTGRSLVTSTRQPSFQAALVGPHCAGVRSVYLTLLAELGSLRTLWYEFQDSQWRKPDLELLVLAVHRYATNARPPLSGGEADALTATGQPEDDLFLDAQTISTHDFSHSQPAAGAATDVRKSATAEAHQLGTGIQGQVLTAFAQERIQDTMSGLQHILQDSSLIQCR